MGEENPPAELGLTQKLRPAQTPPSKTLNPAENIIEHPAISLEKLKDKINLRYWPSIEELCKKEGIDKAHLQDAVTQRANVIFANIQEVKVTIPQLDFLYQIYHALQTREDLSPELLQLKNSLSTYDSFIAKFRNGEQLSSNDFAYFREAVTRVYNEAHPQKVLRVQEKPWGNSGIFAKVYKTPIVREKNAAMSDIWVKVHASKINTTYATPDVITSFEQSKQNGERFILGYNHATTSAALEGIARHGAVLSRSRLKKQGEESVSGESSDWDPRVYSDAGHLAGGHYWNIRWFNEFPITIEFSKDTKSDDKYAPDFGISLGHEIPLRNIARIFCPEEDIVKVQRWIAQYVPHVQVQSFEVYELAGIIGL